MGQKIQYLFSNGAMGKREKKYLIDGQRVFEKNWIRNTLTIVRDNLL